MAPDYSRPDAWAARPGASSHADDVPAGIAPSTHRTVPVFFIHPTTYLAPVLGNAGFAPGGEVQARVDNVVLRFQER